MKQLSSLIRPSYLFAVISAFGVALRNFEFRVQVPEERGHPGHAGPTREVSIGTEKAGVES